jgi:hypothetical protein
MKQITRYVLGNIVPMENEEKLMKFATSIGVAGNPTLTTFHQLETGDKIKITRAVGWDDEDGIKHITRHETIIGIFQFENEYNGSIRDVQGKHLQSMSPIVENNMFKPELV